MRDRMTERRARTKDDSVLAQVERLEAIMADAADKKLESEADQLAKEEVKIVEEGTDVNVSESGDQNDKAMDNWPVTAREAVAARLLRMARALLKED